jgi:methyl-accepting chemotaxis protein
MTYLPRFKEWPILIKIITISVFSVAFITAIILFYFVPLIEGRMMDGKKEGLKNVVDVAYGLLQEYGTLANDGKMSPEDAKAGAINQIRTMRYGDKEYLWINDLKLIMECIPSSRNWMEPI